MRNPNGRRIVEVYSLNAKANYALATVQDLLSGPLASYEVEGRVLTRSAGIVSMKGTEPVHGALFARCLEPIVEHEWKRQSKQCDIGLVLTPPRDLFPKGSRQRVFVEYVMRICPTEANEYEKEEWFLDVDLTAVPRKSSDMYQQAHQALFDLLKEHLNTL